MTRTVPEQIREALRTVAHDKALDRDSRTSAGTMALWASDAALLKLRALIR